MLSATTLDSRSVTFSYEVTGPDPSLSFGVYRSATARLGPGSVPVGSPTAAPAVDDSGLPSVSLGVHQLTIPLAGKLADRLAVGGEAVEGLGPGAHLSFGSNSRVRGKRSREFFVCAPAA